MPFNLSYTEFGLIWLAVALAYVIFSIAGFGTALVAAPVLAHTLPLAQIVPLLALLDCAAAAANLARDGRQADLTELRRLLPCMLLGSALGAAILLRGEARTLLLLLGGFALAYALYGLSGYRPDWRFGRAAAVPFGLVGGVCSALFGSGGFLYAIYLAGRLEQPPRIRVTQSAVIGASTLTRLLLFLLAGVYAERALLMLALALASAMLCGLFIGRRITLTLSRAHFLRLVNLALLAAGALLLLRFFS